MSTDSQDEEPLPVRKRRPLPGGRHRRPDSFSVPTNAPVLVLAVPGRAGPASTEVTDTIAAQIAELKTETNRGARVRVGYLEGAEGAEGAERGLDSALSGLGTDYPPGATAAVLVPLLTGPHPHIDTALRDAAASAEVAVGVSDALGPHPMLAGVLHARLAEAGLARSDRARMLSVATTVEGIIVATVGGEPAVRAAEATSVLLASRLTVPVASAALDGSPDVDEAARRLRAAGATELALAPCVVGPETRSGLVEDAAREIGAHPAMPLGAHPDVAKLVNVRYADALERMDAAAATDEGAGPAGAG